MRVPVVQHSSRRRRARRRRALWTGGEVLVTTGVVLLLLVVHQLWWTNREARHGAERKVAALEREWAAGGAAGGSGPGDGSDGAVPSRTADPPAGAARGGSADTSSPSSPKSRDSGPRRAQTYAVLVVPRLRLRAPVAEGVSKPDVLDKGYVGHYPGTQQPGQTGNFALAGHRNTHGEPFRYLDRLRPKDIVEVETAHATYTYAVDQVLAQTSARDAGVVRAVPRSLVRPGRGYSEPAAYLTLTTCTPEYTSRYRLVVWGKLRSVRERG
ncbi:class E sortase [Streptomyces griseoviridis]